MITFRLALLILAIVSFTLAAFNVQGPLAAPRINFLGLGLLFWVLAAIVTG